MIFAAAAVLIVAVLAFTLVVRQKDLPQPEPVSPTLHLEEKKKAIYDNLRDLQFEYRMGKLSDEDYSATKLELQRELAAVLAEIDNVLKKTAQKPAEGAGTVRPQEAGAARAHMKSPAKCVCPHCLAEFPQPMKFCGECGRAIAATS
jgi:hypothetical protein